MLLMDIVFVPHLFACHKLQSFSTGKNKLNQIKNEIYNISIICICGNTNECTKADRRTYNWSCRVLW